MYITNIIMPSVIPAVLNTYIHYTHTICIQIEENNKYNFFK